MIEAVHTIIIRPPEVVGNDGGSPYTIRPPEVVVSNGGGSRIDCISRSPGSSTKVDIP